MQSYCIFCIYTTFYTIKAYIITIKNKLMNKIPYRYTTKLLSRTIGGSVGMAGCHTLLIKDCLVGALLALASGKAERRQVHPLQDAMPPTDTKKRSPKSFDSEDLK
jgi:hypothetical protein